MNNTATRFVLIFSLICFTVFPVLSQDAKDITEPGEAQDTEEPAPQSGADPDETDEKEAPEVNFDLDLGIGARTFNEGGTQVTYQNLMVAPEISIGKFGFGLYLNINFTFTGGPGNDQFVIRREDWALDSAADFLPTYLPKIKFIRWAEKGEPLYVFFGQIEDGTLGNGFIMANYTNTHFLPEQPIFGLSFDMDGKLYKFPYTGIETFFGNLGVFDVMGGRFYIRPLSFIQKSFVRELQLGVTVAGDRLPFYHIPNQDIDGDGIADTAAPVLIIGTDYRLPIITKENFSLVNYGDLVFEGTAKGGMLGLGGTIINMIPYRADIRFIGKGFIPVYFDSTYDLYRGDKYLLLNGTEQNPAYVGWLLSTGVNLFENRISFLVTADGPFGIPVSETINGVPPSENYQNYPHLRVTLATSDKLFPIYLEASYDKQLIRSWSDLVSPANATVNASLNFKIGPAVLSVDYKLRHTFSADGEDDWETVSGIESLISFF